VNVIGAPSLQGSAKGHFDPVEHQLQTTTTGATALSPSGTWMLAVAEALMSGVKMCPNGASTPLGGGFATTVISVAV
jgi:hypothetical protein